MNPKKKASLMFLVARHAFLSLFTVVILYIPILSILNILAITIRVQTANVPFSSDISSSLISIIIFQYLFQIVVLCVAVWIASRFSAGSIAKRYLIESYDFVEKVAKESTVFFGMLLLIILVLLILIGLTPFTLGLLLIVFCLIVFYLTSKNTLRRKFEKEHESQVSA